jgi:hypothetical protein
MTPLVVRSWILASLAAMFALVGAAVATMERSSVYGRETRTLVDAATSQDLVTAVIVVPGVLVAARHAYAGSVRAHLIGLGAMAFLTYNYAIYCFSVTFGPLFLLWTATLGLSGFALVLGVSATRTMDVEQYVRPTRLASSTLIAVAALFTVLWLAEIGPDILRGRPSTSAAEWNVPTNPVHVLDLAFALPATFACGLALRAGRRWALMAGPGLLVFLALTSLPIIATPVAATLLSHPATWTAAPPVALVGLVALASLRSMLTGSVISSGVARGDDR